MMVEKEKRTNRVWKRIVLLLCLLILSGCSIDKGRVREFMEGRRDSTEAEGSEPSPAAAGNSQEISPAVSPAVTPETALLESAAGQERASADSDGSGQIPQAVDNQEPTEEPGTAGEAGGAVTGREYLTGEWGVDLPENHGIKKAALDDFTRQLLSKPVRSVLLIKDGVIVHEYYREGYHQDSYFDLFSCTKSVTSAAVGIAVKQGLLEGTDVRIGDYFPQINHEEMKSITIEHLLNFTTGIDWSESVTQGMLVDWMIAGNQVDYVLGKEMTSPPGEKFNYSSGNSHLLSAILTQVTGMSEKEFVKKNLFQPIGIGDFRWWSDAQDITFGGFGIWMTSRDAARFGQLYLNEGKWGEEQIIPAEWVAESARPEDEAAFYRYNWWLERDDGGKYRWYYASGYGGQYIFVVPEHRMVAVVMSTGIEDLDVIRMFKDFLGEMDAD